MKKFLVPALLLAAGMAGAQDPTPGAGATPFPAPGSAPSIGTDTGPGKFRQGGGGTEGGYRSWSFQKASDLAQAGKDRENLVVLDLANGDIWNRGERFKIARLADLAKARGWPLRTILEKRDPGGHGRWLERVRNVSVLRYKDRDRGILEMTIPAHPDDFELVTVEGISFRSSAGEVQKALGNDYFTFTGSGTRGSLTLLEYQHGRGLAFDDRLEAALDASGKMVFLRYGVLDEH